MSVISFSVPGEPVGKGRPRFAVSGFARAYTPEKTAKYENLVKLAYRNANDRVFFPQYAELALKIEARFAIPKSASKRAAEEMRRGVCRPTKRPDVDNILKAIADALNGVAYHDDSQIVYVEARKQYADIPETIVTIWEL